MFFHLTWRLIFFFFVYSCSFAIFAKDIAFDFFDGDPVLENKNLDGENFGQVKAFAKFAEVAGALLDKGKLNDEDAKKLVEVLQLEPGSKFPLAILMAYWMENKQTQKLLDNLLPIAEKSPQSDSLALAVALAYVRLDKKDEAVKILERTLDAIDRIDDYKFDKNYVELVIHLGGLYMDAEDFDKGEELYDDAFEKASLIDNFRLRRSAFVFFSQKAKDSEFSFFSGRQERRFYRKMMDSFERIEKVWMQDMSVQAFGGGAEIRTIELAPIVKICKDFGLTERVENLILEKLIDNPKNIEAKLVLAAIFYDMERFASARRLWKGLCDKSKSNFKFFTEYGRAALASRSFDESIKALEWAEFLSSAQQRDGALYLTAMAYMDSGKYEKAMSKLDKLKAMPEALYLKSVCFRRLGENSKAADALNEAEKLAIEKQNKSFLSKEFYMFAAYMNDRARNFDKTLEILKSLYKSNPDDHEILNFLGYILADHGVELDLAKEVLDKALLSQPNNAAYLDSMAWLLYKRKDFKGAYEYILKSLANLENGPDAVLCEHAGDICHALGKNDEALTYWKIASEIFNEDCNIATILGKIRKLNIH